MPAVEHEDGTVRSVQSSERNNCELRHDDLHRVGTSVPPSLTVGRCVLRRDAGEMKIKVAILVAIEKPAVMHRPLPLAVDLFDGEVAGIRLQRFEFLYRLCIVVLARLLQRPCVAGALASLRIDILATRYRRRADRGAWQRRKDQQLNPSYGRTGIPFAFRIFCKAVR